MRHVKIERYEQNGMGQVKINSIQLKWLAEKK